MADIPASAVLDETLAALAEPTRRRVIEMLREGPRAAGELAAAFEMSAPAISRHLRVLRICGLVAEERDEQDARLRIYRLQPERFRDLAGWIAEVERSWTDQLDAFKRYAESPERVGRMPGGRRTGRRESRGRRGRT